MINIIEKVRVDQMVMGITKTNEIRYVIAHTDKGDLCLALRKGEVEHKFYLDAVPYDDKTNKELMEAFNGVLYDL